MTRFSSLNKLLGVIAHVHHFIHSSRHNPSFRLTGPLTVSELSQASLKWIHHAQHSTFGAAINNLTSKSRRLPLVRQLRLFIDCDGLLRCGEHIHNAPLSKLARFSYLLPYLHTSTTLVIKNAHAAQLHSGVNVTLTNICQKYWIPSACQRISTIIQMFVTCTKTSRKPYAMQDLPPLVKSRVSHTEPFTVTGVDYTGTLYIRSQGGECRVYLCLFTCAFSRAIQLYVVPHLTADSFIQAIRRFAGRRSALKLLISDNSSTIMAVSEELKAMFLKFQKPLPAKLLSEGLYQSMLHGLGGVLLGAPHKAR